VGIGTIKLIETRYIKQNSTTRHFSPQQVDDESSVADSKVRPPKATQIPHIYFTSYFTAIACMLHARLSKEGA
jgi:hypothetical protein